MTVGPRSRPRVLGALATSFLLGGIHLSPPIGLLAFIALVPWWASATPLDQKRRGDAGLAYLIGFVSLLIGAHWLREVSWIGLLATVAIEACFYLLIPASARALHRRHAMPAWLAWPIAWTAVEFLRSSVPFGGFPWLILGHSVHIALPLIQIADIGGAPLVSAVLALGNGVLASAWRARRDGLPARRLRRAWIVWSVILAFTLVYGFWRPASLEMKDGPTIAAIQPNIPQYEKSADPNRYFETNLDLTRRLFEGVEESPVDLVVWSETMLHLAEDAGRVEAGVVVSRVIRPYLEPQGVFLLSGASILERDHVNEPPEEWEFFNSALLFDPQGNVRSRHDKMQLVPGGESVPLPDWLGHDLLEAFVERFVVGGNWTFLTPGREARLLNVERNGHAWKIGTTICYENVFPWVGRELATRGAELLVNISNEAWFRDSLEMDQMLGMTKLRAIEMRRSVFRATNSGVSCLVDPRGKVLRVLELEGRRKEVAGVLVATVPISSAETLYGRLGSSWVWALCAWLGVLLAWGFVDARRRKRAARMG